MNPPIPLYKDAKTIEDVNHNFGQLVLILNHNVTTICQDIKWIKKFIAACTTIFILILLAAIGDTAGWV